MTRRATAHWFVTAMLAACVFLTGCLDGPDSGSSPFGYDYRIATLSRGIQPHSVAPTLSGDVLHVTLEYGVCDPRHDFVLEGRISAGNEALLWIRKVTPDELCKVLEIASKEFVVPGRFRACLQITLLGPDGEEYALR